MKTRRKVNDKWARIIGVLLIGIIFPSVSCPPSEWGTWAHLAGIPPSILIAFVIWQGCRFILFRTQDMHPWEKGYMKRLSIEIGLIFLYSSSILFISMYLLDKFHPYIEVQKSDMFLYLTLTFLVTFLITSIYEGVYLFNKWKMSLTESERLQKANILAQYETLKNQVNPHFLFNCLNVLSSLVDKEPDKAIEFIDEFSRVYRYVLESKDKVVVSLKEEMDFANSFIFLQKIRFGESLKIKINIEALKLNDFVPPLSLQVLVDNAIKHNELSLEHPLTIEMFNDDGFLIVKNNLRIRKEEGSSIGIGLSNLKERYSMLSDQETEFYVDNGSYIARIPLIKEE